MTQNTTNKNYSFALLIIGCLFFVFGFITWANSQLIPYLKVACELSKTESYFVGTAFFAAYFVMAVPSSAILKKTGFKKGMSIGLFVMAAGALLFIPAAQQRNYGLFLMGLFIIGTGLTLLQTASNPYVTILGAEEKAAQRMSIMGVCNKLAGICAVYLLGSLFLSDIDTLEKSIHTLPAVGQEAALQNLANKVINPYLVIAGAFAILGVILLFMKLPEVNEGEDIEKEPSASHSVFSHAHLILGAIAIFFYVGAEVISYDAFSTLGEALGFDKKTSASFASYTGYAMLAGYFTGIALIPKIIDQRKALIISSVLSCILVIAAILTSGTTAVVLFALVGFSESVMWPAIWPLALRGLGSKTKLGGAFLIMMIVGGAVLMPLMGVFSDLLAFSGMTKNDAMQWGFLIMIPCYLYILFFALKGYKVKK